MRTLLISFLPFVVIAVWSQITPAGDVSSWQTGTGTIAAPAVKTQPAIMPIQKLFETGAIGHDQSITVEGVFRGWKGKCPSSFMQTRSDWILEDETGCIYVTGKVPARVSPAKPKAERIRVTGRTMTNTKGQVTLKMEKATLVQH